MIYIAQSVRWHRENLNYSSKQVAIQLNLSQSAYSKIESADRLITVAEFKLLAEFFEITMNDLCEIPSRKNKLE